MVRMLPHPTRADGCCRLKGGGVWFLTHSLALIPTEGKSCPVPAKPPNLLLDAVEAPCAAQLLTQIIGWALDFLLAFQENDLPEVLAGVNSAQSSHAMGRSSSKHQITCRSNAFVPN